MSLKKLSFILSTLFMLNSYAMQEPTEKPVGNTDEQPSQEQTAKKTLVKSPEVQTLKYFCAKQVLINLEELNTDEEFAKNIPMELQDYLKYVHKKEELNQHRLVPVFKKYLEKCLDSLSFEAIQEILSIITKVYQKSHKNCIELQNALPTYDGRFYDNYFLEIIRILNNIAITNINLRELIEELKENKKRQIIDALSNLSQEDKLIHDKLNFTLLYLGSSPNPDNDKLYELANNGHIPAIHALAAMKFGLNLHQEGLSWAEKLMHKDALDYAAHLILSVLTYSFSLKLRGINNQNILGCNDFREFINKLIMQLTDKNKYKPEYDHVLTLIYAYLNDTTNAKKYAEKYWEDNPEILNGTLAQILRVIYKLEGNSEKEAFCNAKLAEVRAFRSNVNL